MTNPLRGELKIVLNNTEFKTKLTLDTIFRIEESISSNSIVEAATNLANGFMPSRDIFLILSTAIRAGGTDMSDNEIKKHIWAHGIVGSMSVVGEILANALTAGLGEDELEGKQEAV